MVDRSEAPARVARIYSETLPFERVARGDTVALLARYDLALVLAVRPWQLAELPDVARALRDAGVPLSLWPMLGDEEGRWANDRNAAAFARFVRGVVETLDEARVPAREVLLDLEPPFADAKSLSHGARGVLRIASAAGRAVSARGAFAASAAELARLVAELHERDVATSSAVWPLVALDPPGLPAWQPLLGTPVDRLATSRVSVMLYTSILEGWSRGALDRPHAAELLAAGTARSLRRWGPGAGVSLGCVGAGAFDDEPVYRGPAELAEDAALARREGCVDLSLFDLGGVLTRPPPEAWLDAFVHGEDALDAAARRALVPAASRRVAAARAMARAATWALGRIGLRPRSRARSPRRR